MKFRRLPIGRLMSAALITTIAFLTANQKVEMARDADKLTAGEVVIKCHADANREAISSEGDETFDAASDHENRCIEMAQNAGRLFDK